MYALEETKFDKVEFCLFNYYLIVISRLLFVNLLQVPSAFIKTYQSLMAGNVSFLTLGEQRLEEACF